jgi:hypothetical protein
MAAQKPARKKSAPNKGAPVPKKAAPKKAAQAPAAPAKKARRREALSVRTAFEDLRFLPVVPVPPASPSMLHRINAMAERINAALVPVVRRLRHEATTEAEMEDIVRLLHQLFASNCGRFEAMLVAHRLSMSAEAGYTVAEMKLLAAKLGEYFSSARCEVFNSSFDQYLDSGGRDDIQPTAVPYETRRARKRDDTLN